MYRKKMLLVVFVCFFVGCVDTVKWVDESMLPKQTANGKFAMVLVGGRVDSITENAIIIKTESSEYRERMCFTITTDTKYVDVNGNKVQRDTLSLKGYDYVTVLTKSFEVALAIKKGGLR